MGLAELAHGAWHLAIPEVIKLLTSNLMTLLIRFSWARRNA